MYTFMYLQDDCITTFSLAKLQVFLVVCAGDAFFIHTLKSAHTILNDWMSFETSRCVCWGWGTGITINDESVGFGFQEDQHVNFTVR